MTAQPVLAAASLVRERFAEPLSVGDLADHVGYSPFHFSRLFAAGTGVGPGEYLAAVRIDAAKRLLLHGDDAVVDVAVRVGFDSPSSFSRRFRASVGVPPGGLRRLADRVADRPPQPFRLGDARQALVRVRPEVPQPLLPPGELSVWVGWFPKPAPIGLPAGGLLARYGDRVELPLAPGAPWLLGFAVPGGADVEAQLVPSEPLVAVHPAPVTSGGSVTLTFGAPAPTSVPLLSALPSLCRR